MIRLIESPLKEDLQTLGMLEERYADTLATIEEESNRLEQAFEEMMQQLVVSN